MPVNYNTLICNANVVIKPETVAINSGKVKLTIRTLPQFCDFGGTFGAFVENKT